MGGYGSGRRGGRPTVEDGLTLDINKLRRDQLIRRGCGWGGTLKWAEAYSGRHIASIGYQALLGTEQGRLRLHYETTRSDGTQHNRDYWVDLATTPKPFGGRRWRFMFPRTGKHVSKLHLPPGALTFASREAYRLQHHCQRQAPRDRSLSRAFKARRRLGNLDGIDGFIVKPKGMPSRTFNRLMAKVDAAGDVVDHHTVLLLNTSGAEDPRRFPREVTAR
jgi:hypothetical protein